MSPFIILLLRSSSSLNTNVLARIATAPKEEHQSSKNQSLSNPHLPPQPNVMNHTLIDTAAGIATMMESLSNLPTAPPSLLKVMKVSWLGSVSILQIHVSTLKHIFLVDIHILRPSAFITTVISGKTLKTVMEDGNVPKVFFDVRNDSDALFYHHCIRLQGVHDTQPMACGFRSTVFPKT